MSLTVELIYDRDCPNVAEARVNLVRALTLTQAPARWTEWECSANDAPEYARRYGSPTILVNSVDISPLESDADGACCRMYGSPGRYRGTPPVETIAAALKRSGFGHGTWKGSLLALPGLSIALLPKLACPMCWPAYAALLTSVGLGFLLSSTYLAPLTVVFLIAAAAPLAYRARSRHGYGPSVLGSVAALTIAGGKFVFESTAMTYVGFLALLVAVVWNSWPPRIATCEKCVTRTCQEDTK